MKTWLLLGLCLVSSLSWAQRLDQYGGVLSKPCKSTQWFHTEKISNEWWFCTPDGHAWWMVAMYNVSSDSHKTDLGTSYEAVARAKYLNSDTIWGPQTVRRIKSWGFNSVAEFSVKWVLPITTCAWPPSCPGGWEQAKGRQPYPVPMLAMVQPSMYSLQNLQGYAPGSVKDIQSGINTDYYGGYNSTFPDLWDSNFRAWLDGELKNDPDITVAENSPWVVGWVSDECDALYGLCGAGPEMATSPPGFNQRHQGLMTLLTSPVQNANPGRAMVARPQLYANQEVFSKVQLKRFLQARYGSIAALNSAWGSEYTQWDSTGESATDEVIGVGDGTTVTFTNKLAHRNISSLSVALKIGGVKVAGDCPRWMCSGAGFGDGTFAGPNSGISSGRIGYQWGTVTVILTKAPPKGVTVALDYTHDGWGYGTGLMDEDGRHKWIPRDKVHLGSNTAFSADMDAFLKAIATEYFKVTRDRIRYYSPKSLYFGPGVLGTWGGVGNKNVLQAASEFVDVLTWQPDYHRLQSELDYVAKYFGDKPIILWYGAKATSDSAMWRYVVGVDAQCSPCNSQEDRGRFYADSMNAFLNTRNAVFKTRTIIGMRWWEFHDNWREGNWGVVTLHDNAYDGVEACQGISKTPMGFMTTSEEVVPEWQPNQGYKVPGPTPQAGSRIQVLAGNMHYTFEAVKAGTSSYSSPSWPSEQGATVRDGSVVWKNVGRKTSQSCYGDFLTPVKKANSLWMEAK